MKHRILLFFLSLTSLSSNARNIPIRGILRDAYHDIQHSLLLFVSGAIGSALIVFLVLFLIERRKKQKPGDNISSKRSIPDAKPASEVEKSGSKTETETEVESVGAIPFEAPLESEAEKLLQNNLPDSFLMPVVETAQRGSFFWGTSLPGKVEGQSGAFLLCVGNAGEMGKDKIVASLINGVKQTGLPSPETLMQLAYMNEEGRQENICCAFDLKGGWLRFSGKRMPLWLVRKGEVKEFPGGEGDAYGLQTIGLRKGDCIFILSDQLSSEVKDALKAFFLTNVSLPMKDVKMELVGREKMFPNTTQIVGMRIN
jgi:hypothetical protein